MSASRSRSLAACRLCGAAGVGVWVCGRRVGARAAGPARTHACCAATSRGAAGRARPARLRRAPRSRPGGSACRSPSPWARPCAGRGRAGSSAAAAGRARAAAAARRLPRRPTPAARRPSRELLPTRRNCIAVRAPGRPRSRAWPAPCWRGRSLCSRPTACSRSIGRVGGVRVDQGARAASRSARSLARGGVDGGASARANSRRRRGAPPPPARLPRAPAPGPQTGVRAPDAHPSEPPQRPRPYPTPPPAPHPTRPTPPPPAPTPPPPYRWGRRIASRPAPWLPSLPQHPGIWTAQRILQINGAAAGGGRAAPARAPAPKAGPAAPGAPRGGRGPAGRSLPGAAA
jgi:hypothetical protein